MRCKPDDLAVIVRSECGNEGLFVTCLRLHPPGTDLLFPEDGPVWEVDRPLRASWGPDSPFIPDSYLRPIRPSDGADETLTWAGRPEKVEA